ncbi:hypothetical protein BKA93DRAFT_767442 [Sparassis latifolia]
MFTLREIFRFVQTLAVPVIFGLVVKYLVPKSDDNTLPPSLYLPILADIGFVPRSFPVTYRLDGYDFKHYERIQNVSFSVPDTTAVILNWSRFPNVLLITSLLCGDWLGDVIVEVSIWNNNPRQLTYEDFKNTGCPKDRLRIYNAPANMYFQGRFMGCAQARTPYCFVQDDDYLVRSEIVHALHKRMRSSSGSYGIYLTPPREHLTSTLREIRVSKPESSYLSDIHASFTWLGYGAIIHRSDAIDFISLLRRIRASDDEMKMADNFFTILSNRVPEIWFDREFELGGGQPFTIGPEGDERNNRYIQKATQYLESITHCNAPSCTSAVDAKPARAKLPYTSFQAYLPPPTWQRAACRGSSCVLETNIHLLPDTIGHTGDSIQNMLYLEKHNLELLGEAAKQHYIDYAPSNAVDTLTDTSFRSPGSAKKGDIISIDLLADVSEAYEWTIVEMAWLVDSATEAILDACTFESSMDQLVWHHASQRPICNDTDLRLPSDNLTSEDTPTYLRECSVQMLVASDALHLRATGRYFRVRLEEDQPEGWAVFEIWLRGL